MMKNQKENFLKDNKMVRLVNGELKDVISETEFIQKYGAFATLKIVKQKVH